MKTLIWKQNLELNIQKLDAGQPHSKRESQVVKKKKVNRALNVSTTQPFSGKCVLVLAAREEQNKGIRI